MSDSNPADFGFKLLVYEGDLNNIANWVARYPNNETGGDLFGFWTHSRAPAVQFVLGPGHSARHEVAAFYQDRRYLAQIGTELQTCHGLQHIGEWHSHHKLGLETPSGGDQRTIHRMFESTGFSSFLLCIATIIDKTNNNTSRSVNKHSDWGNKQYENDIAYETRYYNNDPMGQGGASRDYIVQINAYLFRNNRRTYERGMWVVHNGESPITRSMMGKSMFIRPDTGTTEWHVPRTTLAKRFTNDEPRLEAPPNGWYTMPKWSTLLRELNYGLQERYSACNISMINTDLVMYFGNDGAKFAILFPTQFPDEPAVLCKIVGRDAKEEGYIDFGYTNESIISSQSYLNKITLMVSNATQGGNHDMER